MVLILRDTRCQPQSRSARQCYLGLSSGKLDGRITPQTCVCSVWKLVQSRPRPRRSLWANDPAFQTTSVVIAPQEVRFTIFPDSAALLRDQWCKHGLPEPRNVRQGERKADCVPCCVPATRQGSACKALLLQQPLCGLCWGLACLPCRREENCALNMVIRNVTGRRALSMLRCGLCSERELSC